MHDTQLHLDPNGSDCAVPIPALLSNIDIELFRVSLGQAVVLATRNLIESNLLPAGRH